MQKAGNCDVEMAMCSKGMAIERIGQIFIRQTSLTQEQLDVALGEQERQSVRRRIGQILIEKQLISAEQVQKALAEQLQLDYIDSITPEQINPLLVRKFPMGFLRRWFVLPIIMPGSNTSAIAIADPLDVETYDAVVNVMGRHCRRVLCPPSEIDQAISTCYYKTMGLTEAAEHSEIEEFDMKDNSILSSTQAEDLLNIANQPPTIRTVNAIFFRAMQSRASDIHIEPYEKELKVRFRIDGVLHDILSLPRQQSSALISRLKIMANLNIAERRLPQDGQSRIKIGPKQTDIRVSTVPTSGGERVVLRILDKSNQELSLAEVGFTLQTQERFREFIHLPHGIILLTGPTGSGKTTSLYAAINELNCQERNILTVEDPIEYQLQGVGQMQVKPKIDLTFASCLKHILRQDPDIIMVGEIRDRETAEISIQASLTGHLVLSTLHTNDSVSAITRLIDMGIEPYLVASSLMAVMAQRLVRRICKSCKVPYSPQFDIASLWDTCDESVASVEQIFRGEGCGDCLHTGYLGRAGIFELLGISGQVKEMITNCSTQHAVKDAAIAAGMTTLRDSGMQKVAEGVTTIEEVLRVTRENTGTNTEIDHNVA